MTNSVISKPALLVDLPEVRSIESKFIYNFFTPDERINETSNVYGSVGFTSTNIDLEGSNYADNIGTSNIQNESLRAFYGRNAIYPRFNRITITKPLIDIDRSLTIARTDVKNVPREDTLNVFGRVGASIIDTELDKTVYSLLSGSIASPAAQETSSASQRILDAIVNSIQPDGYRYAATDARQGPVNTVEETLQGLSFGFSYLPNVAGTITEASLNSSKNVYVDEISSTRELLKSIEQTAVAGSRPYVLRTSDYEAGFNFINNRVESDLRLKNNLIGYIIQKFGTLTDGTLDIFSEKIVLNPNVTSFVDPDIAYGRRYKYRVIALYACQFQMNSQVSSGRGPEEDGVVTKYALFASRGADTTVICEEYIAPPPPVDLAFRYRADNTGLNITWNFPVNLQGDIKKIQVFRRRSTSEPFQLIRMYDFDDSAVKTPDPEGVPERLITRGLLPVTLHKDTEFNKNSKFIYAVCAIDAHGYTSNYSVQLEASYDRYRNKINTRVISRSDAPKPYPNIFLNRDTFIDTMKMSGYTRLNIYFDPEYVKITNAAGDDQSHIVFNNNRGDDNSYKLLIVNTDFQQSQTLDIKINDSYAQPPVITPSTARVFRPT